MNKHPNNCARFLLFFFLTALIGSTQLYGNEVSVSDKTLYYSGKNSEIYSSNFLGIETSSVNYAFTYSTGRSSYFALILDDKNNTLIQIKVKNEYHLTEYKKYDDFIVITGHINPSLNEYYIYDTVNKSLTSLYGGSLIIVDGKIVSIVYPPHFSVGKETVKIEVNGKEILQLPFSYYSLEKAGKNKVKISEFRDSTSKINLDKATIEVDTSIILTI